MNSLRQLTKRSLLWWSILLSVALLCVQSSGLHVHNLGHAHESQSSVHFADEAEIHTHMTQAHSAHDLSHPDYHNDAVSKIDINPDGLLESFSEIFVVALGFFIFSLKIFFPIQQQKYDRREDKTTTQKHHILLPPLRAPPLY